jgi:transposase
MLTVPKPYPKQFRDDVIAIARRREPDVTLAQIATDFGISESYLKNWLSRAHPRRRWSRGLTTGEVEKDRALRRGWRES